MVEKIRNGQGLIHYHTSGKTGNEINKPDAANLYEGEIAINTNVDEPSLFIKNSSGGVTQFVDKEYIDSALKLAENITYAQLVSKIAANSGAGSLEPGKLYRITDFVTTTKNGSNPDVTSSSITYKSAGHQFDLIVMATSSNKLDCQAKAVIHSGDTYFSTSDLYKWQIWYDINNDTNTYEWADSTNGKGVIYRMIDERNNDLPYDFKNILFKRKLTNGRYDPTNGTLTWVYTFGGISDASISSNNCRNNILKACINSYYYSLPDNVFLGTTCLNNTFGKGCSSNTFGGDCDNNTFGSNCQDNTFVGGVGRNTFGDYCVDNTFGDYCVGNTFGDVFESNTFGTRCESNNFGDNCMDNTFGDDCGNNTFGNYCLSNTFGDDCGNNTFGNYCLSNTFGDSNNQNGNCIKCVTIESDNRNIRLYNSSTANSYNYLQNIYIAQGVNTSDTYLDISTIARNLSYRTTVARATDGTLRIYNEDDPVSVPSTTVPIKMVDETDGKTYTYNILYTNRVEEVDYLCFTAEADNVQIGMKQNYSFATSVTIQYSTDKVNWADFTPDTTNRYFCTLNTGDKIYLKGNVSAFGNSTYTYAYNYFISTGNFAASGSIDALRNFSTNLTDYCYYYLFNNCTGLTSAPELPATTLASNCYSNMFQGCTSLITAPSVLPATTLAQVCCSGMFNGCTSLTTAPELPATRLAQSCYLTMFQGCTSLTTAPELPATTLASNCYSGMFYGCTSLTTAPLILPATTLANQCYNSMFNGCTSLTTVPELPATTLVSNCYNSMFKGCTLLTTAPELPATTLASQCYESMFQSCTSLTTAPELTATTLASNCYRDMFNGCTSLTTAPELPATTLPNNCYNSMFKGCTSLTTAPELPATTLASNCYSGMFYGCTSLYKVTCLATNLSASNCTTNWLANVSSYGIFTKHPDMSGWTTNSAHGIPTGWVSKDYTDFDYLCFTAEANNVQIGMRKNYPNASSVTFQYSTDKVNWTDFTPDTTDRYFCTLNTGNKVYLQGNIEAFGNPGSYNYFISSGGTFVATGNINSLRNFSSTLSSYCYGNLFRNCTGLTSAAQLELPATTLAEGCYNYMFQGCNSLTTAPLILPATTLANQCYNSMFNGCTSLTTVPELPATTLAGYCYNSMFQNCTSLTTAPELPATTLAGYCYNSMFQNCTSLTTAPSILPATTLVSNCYNSMFNGCTSLTTVPELPATTLAGYCYNSMFQNCTSLTTAPELPATTLANQCYNSMFRACSSLTTAPELPATTLAFSCYQRMFYDCTSLTTAPELPATTLAENCYPGMFQGCTSLTIAPKLPATSLTFACYGSMFENCTSLNGVICLATDISAFVCVENWLNNVSPTGVFLRNPNTSWSSGGSGIPSGWTHN